jgi:redox-sensitive bicupin YhaK (pirin superfamily)
MIMCGAELRPLLAVKAIVDMPFHSFDGISGANMLRVDSSWINPFIGVDSYTLRSNPFGPHPHAGMSAVSLTLPESEAGTINRDTMGDHSLISPGDLHWFQAGRGAMHEETPAAPGKTEQGLQIFVNLSRANKAAAPVGLRVAHQDMPVVNFEGGSLRVVAGEFDGQSSPIAQDPRWLTRVNMLDVTLQRGASVDIPVNSGDNAFFIIRSGAFEAVAGIDIAQSAIIFESRRVYSPPLAAFFSLSNVSEPCGISGINTPPLGAGIFIQVSSPACMLRGSPQAAKRCVACFSQARRSTNPSSLAALSWATARKTSWPTNVLSRAEKWVICKHPLKSFHQRLQGEFPWQK